MCYPNSHHLWYDSLLPTSKKFKLLKICDNSLPKMPMYLVWTSACKLQLCGSCGGKLYEPEVGLLWRLVNTMPQKFNIIFFIFPLCSQYFCMVNTSGSFLVTAVDGLWPLALEQSPEVSCIISGIDPHCWSHRPHQYQGGILWNVSFNEI